MLEALPLVKQAFEIVTHAYLADPNQYGVAHVYANLRDAIMFLELAKEQAPVEPAPAAPVETPKTE